MGLSTLRLQLRFLLPLVLVLVTAAYLALPLMDRLTLRWFARDLNLRGELVVANHEGGVRTTLRFPRSRQAERLVR
jgi:trehalose 6-phosphate synthase